MEVNTFPSNNLDLSAKAILDKYYKVEHKDNYPKFTPYTDKVGEKISPLTDFMYYHKLPEVYRTFDEALGKPLYRYLQSLIEGGYAEVVNSTLKGKRGIENLLDLIDPQTCPDEFLPYYCKSMGIEWFPDLITEERGTYYLRTFLCNIGEIYKRRGTESVVKYIAKVLTEMDVVINYERLFDTGKNTKARVMWIELQAHTQEEISRTKLSSQIIKRYVDTQIPYYITSAVLYVIHFETQTGIYTGNFLRSTIRKTVKCKMEEPIIDKDNYIYVIQNNGVKLIFYKGNENIVQIPTEIEGKPVTEIEATCFTNSDIESIIIPNTITKIY